MKTIQAQKKLLTLKSEEQLLLVLNNIRNHENIMGINGNFNMDELKQFAQGHSYCFFTIPKKNGGKRQICAPNRSLAFIQLCIAVLLNSLYKPNKNVYGFVNGKSIVDNAINHVNKHFILNIDLKDFFTSISKDVIIEKLVRQPYYFSYKAANLIANLTTVKLPDGTRVLPQGAPSSPILTNIVADHLDVRLSRLSEKYGLQYTRYADDITFSFDNAILKKMKSHGRIRRGLRDIIEDIIQDEGFTINKKKYRFSFPNQQHEVTGLIVNQKVNIRRQYIKNIRTEIHNWEKDGYIKASYSFFKFCDQFHRKQPIASMENVIDGKLSYIKMVKGDKDTTYLKLRERYNQLYLRDKHLIEIANPKTLNIFDLKLPKIGTTKYNGTWKEIKLRPFSDKERELVLSTIIIRSKYGNTVKFQLKNGKIKYIPLSTSSALSIGEKLDLLYNKILFLHNGVRTIYRIL